MTVENSWSNVCNRITISYTLTAKSLFRLEKGGSLTYTYTYHEIKLIVDGTLIIEDETGQKKTGKVGDLFYFNKGTTVTFTTPDFGIGFFVGQREEGEA